MLGVYDGFLALNLGPQLPFWCFQRAWLAGATLGLWPLWELGRALKMELLQC